MAKPINPTPVLTGKYAKQFLEDMGREPTEKEIEMGKRMLNPQRKLNLIY